MAENTVFYTLLFGSVIGLILLFSVSLILAIKGAKYKLVILLNSCIIVHLICYLIYSYNYEIRSGYYKVWYFLNFLGFGIVHWSLAFTYFTSAIELPYVFNLNEVPKEIKLRNTIIFWSLLVLSSICSVFPFFKIGSFIDILFFTIYFTIMGIASVLMVVALTKIRNFLTSQGLGA
jgi:hypothetical protein